MCSSMGTGWLSAATVARRERTVILTSMFGEAGLGKWLLCGHEGWGDWDTAAAASVGGAVGGI